MAERMPLPGQGAQRQGLDQAEHAQLGHDLQALQHYLLQLQATISKRYGKTQYCSLKLADLHKDCEVLRFTLDDLASEEHQTTPGSFYYGQPEPAPDKAAPLPRLIPD